MRPALQLLVLLCHIAAVPADVDGMQCYSCGGLVSDQPGRSCAEFDEALSWSLFVVTCPEDHICVKTSSLYSGEEDREFRGCGARQSWYGLKHELGCREADMPDSQTQFCFCDTPLCNAAPSQRTAPGLGTVLTVAVMAAAGAGVLRPHR
ncbi:uncharacterized protein LOC122393338 [Amphibalanus amphitrite]|uniref:uncharacterized protein LOC122393338 n=1 Tax=Amphibalanus amphitrite TaxID=1232801 RepID=UPI001C914DB9|nr:uncharacterized protein LOC122393338 [Amphibalanus amphitrite]